MAVSSHEATPKTKTKNNRPAARITGAVLALAAVSGFESIPAAEAINNNPIIETTNNNLSDLTKKMLVQARLNDGVDIRHIKIGGRPVDRLVATASRRDKGRQVYDSFIADTLPGHLLPFRTYIYAGSTKPEFNMSEDFIYKGMTDHLMLPDESYNMIVKDRQGDVIVSAPLFSAPPSLKDYPSFSHKYETYTGAAEGIVDSAIATAGDNNPSA